MDGLLGLASGGRSGSWHQSKVKVKVRVQHCDGGRCLAMERGKALPGLNYEKKMIQILIQRSRSRAR